MSSLSDLLALDCIAIDQPAHDWRAAIQEAGTLLEQGHIATAEYTAAMVQSMEDHGPYIVVAPGVAFAHARPSPAVLQTGMALVRLQEPVCFGHPDNDPVQLVFALAATDAKAHQQALAALANVIGKATQRQRLLEAPTPAALHDLLTGQATASDQRTAPGTPAAASAQHTAPGTPAAAFDKHTALDQTTASGQHVSPTPSSHEPTAAAHKPASPKTIVTDHRTILTVCGNGVGTSLFLKNTVETVLSAWGWDSFVTVEATDTISAKGKAQSADFVLTSAAIANTLGDVGVPVHIIRNFTSPQEVDAALRAVYDLEAL